ncbi:hypothetical protein [Photobacterium atrarenae]|uniref:Uncharacterized protein n=1 Tax=Photobacterium atrarenae TaxID=865757 RepID=A0ABY5GQG3_9GAMM|nr:hypothetical protein [Photobacterium atrarenae]UTV30762.1 hypothetical protein NNL38_19585 [Photobacterium atrarenae]
MQTVKRSEVNPAPAKQQRPMGFSEFNHCVDVLLGRSPGTGHATQTTAAKLDRAPSPASACWEHNRYFSGQQAA